MSSSGLLSPLPAFSTGNDRSKLLMAGAGLLAVFLYKLVERRNNDGRPPMLKYWVPWLGSAIELGKNPDGIFARATAQLGPIFRIKAAGQDFTYVTSPELISAIYRESKIFEFVPIRMDMAYKIFDVAREVNGNPVMTEDLFKTHHAKLSPKNVGEIHKRYGGFTYESIQIALDNSSDTPITRLSPFLKPAAYDAALYAFFGKSYNARASYQPFIDFDNGFPLLQAGAPKFLLKKTLAGRDQLTEITKRYLTGPHSDCSDFVSSIEEIANEAKWPLKDVANIFITDVWAMQANAINVAYW
ncbi:hypothetical protein M422DRAFT_252463, partial [Sphaerobolus stellatus SS14]